MSHQDRVMFALNVATGPKAEESIDNATFLRSYAEYGVWLRIVPAATHLRAAADAAASEFSKIAHAAAFWSQAAMLYEDVVSMLAALAAVTSQRTLHLADVLHRLNLRRNSAAGGAVPEARSLVAQVAGSEKRANLDPAVFVESLRALKGEQILALVGVPWHPEPPAHVPHDNGWRRLPELTEEIVRLLSDRNGGLMTTYYNKVKHGPQAIVDDVRRVALEARGHDESVRSGLPPGPHLRVLLQGARTHVRARMNQDGTRLSLLRGPVRKQGRHHLREGVPDRRQQDDRQRLLPDHHPAAHAGEHPPGRARGGGAGRAQRPEGIGRGPERRAARRPERHAAAQGRRAERGRRRCHPRADDHRKRGDVRREEGRDGEAGPRGAVRERPGRGEPRREGVQGPGFVPMADEPRREDVVRPPRHRQGVDGGLRPHGGDDLLLPGPHADLGRPLRVEHHRQHHRALSTAGGLCPHGQEGVGSTGALLVVSPDRSPSLVRRRAEPRGHPAGDAWDPVREIVERRVHHPRRALVVGAQDPPGERRRVAHRHGAGDERGGHLRPRARLE